MKIKNIFSKIEKNISKEIFESIIKSENIKIERIISKGQTTPNGEWYNQEENEFVLLIKGEAELIFENEEKVNMKKGDYIIIPAHKKHRVEKTSETEETIWLAVFYK